MTTEQDILIGAETREKTKTMSWRLLIVIALIATMVVVVYSAATSTQVITNVGELIWGKPTGLPPITRIVSSFPSGEAAELPVSTTPWIKFSSAQNPEKLILQVYYKDAHGQKIPLMFHTVWSSDGKTAYIYANWAQGLKDYAETLDYQALVGGIKSPLQSDTYIMAFKPPAAPNITPNPGNGATGVSVSAGGISYTSDKPLSDFRITSTGPITGAAQWSADKKTVTFPITNPLGYETAHTISWFATAEDGSYIRGSNLFSTESAPVVADVSGDGGPGGSKNGSSSEEKPQENQPQEPNEVNMPPEYYPKPIY